SRRGRVHDSCSSAVACDVSLQCPRREKQTLQVQQSQRQPQSAVILVQRSSQPHSTCVCALTLVCCSLLATLLLGSQLLLAVASQSPRADLSVCRGLDCWEESGVVHRRSATVGG